jgi:hypothetical protein
MGELTLPICERLRARVAINSSGNGTAFSDPLCREAADAIDELYAALRLAREMFVANNLYLERTFEKIDEAIANAVGERP